MLMKEDYSNTVILIDSNALCHKAKHTVGELNNETMRVGVIFGFFLQILKYAKEHGTNQFAFVWDSKTSHRTKIYPGYKEKRRTTSNEKTPEEKEFDRLAYAQFDLLYGKYLKQIGFKNNYKFAGFEGDDLIASIVDTNIDTDFYIASGDEDMYQCLTVGVSILKNKGIYTAEDFKNEYCIDPSKWAEVKAIAGCDSDEVPGIKGVGEKTAIKFINGLMSPNMKGYQNINSKEGKEIIARNRKLVTLPFSGCPEITIKKDDFLSLDGFIDMCNELDFKFFLKKEQLSQWKQCLNMK